EERVRVRVRPGPARAPGELVRAWPGCRVCHVDVDVAVAVERGRVPEAAAAVDVSVGCAPEVLGNGPELPLRLAGIRVQRPEHSRAVALVERLRVPRDGRDVHGPVEDS